MVSRSLAHATSASPSWASSELPALEAVKAKFVLDDADAHGLGIELPS